MTHQSNIFIEAYKLKNPNSGLGQFCYHLLNSLCSIPELDITVGISKQTAIPDNWPCSTSILKPLHRMWGVPLTNYKVYHATHQDTAFLPRANRLPVILTVHDLNFLYKYAPLRRRLKLQYLQHLIDRAACITAVSEFTASELRTHLNLKSKKVHVIYNGNPLHANITAEPVQLPSQHPFLLFVGTLTPHKQVHLLIEMMRYISDLNLVIAGAQTSKYAQLLNSELHKLKLQSRVYMLGEVSDGQKLWLYQHCNALVFPSQAEGFGLPVIEAMSVGKPVYISNLASLPEIGGTHACIWQSLNPPEMADFVYKTLNSVNTPTKVNERIEHAAQFSWKSATVKYFNLYQNYL